MSEQFDAIVAGGGLAGASAGISLAREGRKVLILEKAAFPRPKVCGEFLSPGAWPTLEELGVLEEVLRQKGTFIERVSISFGGKQRQEYPLPRSGETRFGGYGLSRKRLDTLLLQRAARSGCAVLHKAEVTDAARDKKGFQVKVLRREGEEKVLRFQTPLLVNAAGPSLRSRQRPPKRRGLTGFKAHFYGAAPEGSVRLFFFQGGYLGLAGIEEGLTNVCGICRPEVIKEHKGSWDRLLENIARKDECFGNWLTSARRSEGWLACSPLRHGKQSIDFSSGFPVGDAACFLEPFMGQGMTMALGAGRLLSACFDQHEPETAYLRSLEKFYRRRLWIGKGVQAAAPSLAGGNGIARKFLQSERLWKPLIRAACSAPEIPRGIL